MAATAIERIVVQATLSDKQAIATKAKKFGIPVSELMRRGAFAYASDEAGQELDALADAAKGAADRAGSQLMMRCLLLLLATSGLPAWRRWRRSPPRQQLGRLSDGRYAKNMIPTL